MWLHDESNAGIDIAVSKENVRISTLLTDNLFFHKHHRRMLEQDDAILLLVHKCIGILQKFFQPSMPFRSNT